MCTPTKGISVEELVDEMVKKRREDLINAPKHSTFSTFRKNGNMDAVRRHLIFENCSTDDDSDADDRKASKETNKPNNLVSRHAAFKKESNDSGLFSTPESCRSPEFAVPTTPNYRFRQLSPVATDTSEESDSSLIEFPETPVTGKKRRRRPHAVINKVLADMGAKSVVYDNIKPKKNMQCRNKLAIKRKQDLCIDEPENKVIATPNRRGRSKNLVENPEDVIMFSANERTPTRRLKAKRRTRPVEPLTCETQEDFSLTVAFEKPLEERERTNISNNDKTQLHVQENYIKSKHWAIQLGYPSSCDDDSCITDVSSVGEDHMEALCLL